MAFFDQSTKILHGREVPQILHPQASLGEVLLFTFFKWPEKVLQVCDEDGVAVTCAEMSDMMTNVAKNLCILGYRLGDVVGIIATNTSFVAPAIFGCTLRGLPLSPLDVSFNVGEIVKIYKETKPKLIFCDHDMVEKLITALEILESEARIVILTKRLEGFMHISDWLVEPEQPMQL